MVTLHVTETQHIPQKMIGLIGRSTPISLLLRTRFGIHTFGVRFPIDILVINNQKTVISFKERLLPNRIFFWNPLYCLVLELPVNTIRKKKIRLGDTIELKILK